MVLKRQPSGSEKKLLIIVNLDPENRTTAAWEPVSTGLNPSAFYDLLSGEEINVTESNGLNTLLLEPGQVLCLSASAADLQQVQNFPKQPFLLPERIEQQRLYAKALEVVSWKIRRIFAAGCAPMAVNRGLLYGSGRRTCGEKS
jgi:hypothetical protein